MDDVGEKQKKRRESEGRGDANAPKDQQTNEKAMVILVFCCCTWLATVAKCTRCIGVVLGSEPVFFFHYVAGTYHTSYVSTLLYHAPYVFGWCVSYSIIPAQSLCDSKAQC